MPARRYFTPEEANRTLPLVRRIVADILAVGAEVRALAANKPVDEESVRARVLRLEQLVAELEQLGCYFKDWSFETGLVDFPARLDGEDVLLCWRSDEDAVAHYHGYSEGFAGRKALPMAARERRATPPAG